MSDPEGRRLRGRGLRQKSQSGRQESCGDQSACTSRVPSAQNFAYRIAGSSKTHATRGPPPAAARLSTQTGRGRSAWNRN